MLNHIWLGLIVIAIAVALGRDITELSTNRFQNDESVTVMVNPGALAIAGPNHYSGKALLLRSTLASRYGRSEVASMKTDSLILPVDLVSASTGEGTATLTLSDAAPGILTDLAQANGDATKLIGKAKFSGSDPTKIASFALTPEPVYFRVMAKVANDGILTMANTAVTIALGLIGVMALWLGIMKIAEAAGLVGLLARLVRPIMVRLFPDVPPEHPAMGAMVMNMAANFLGLSNAATPLGLKAMEELNNLNPIAGTATNAMCMFLTINTTALTLVPATVIAIRLSLGSHDASEIIMPTFLATLCSLILGVTFTRLIQRFYPLPPNPQHSALSTSPEPFQ
jgi:spore maturation protein SpmA